MSWKKTAELLVEVAGHAEDIGYEVPSLIVAAKDDLDAYPMAIQDSTRVVLSLWIISIVSLNSFFFINVGWTLSSINFFKLCCFFLTLLSHDYICPL